MLGLFGYNFYYGIIRNIFSFYIMVNKKISRQEGVLILLHEADMMPNPLKNEMGRFELIYFLFCVNQCFWL